MYIYLICAKLCAVNTRLARWPLMPNPDGCGCARIRDVQILLADRFSSDICRRCSTFDHRAIIIIVKLGQPICTVWSAFGTRMICVFVRVCSLDDDDALLCVYYQYVFGVFCR